MCDRLAVNSMVSVRRSEGNGFPVAAIGKKDIDRAKRRRPCQGRWI
jgi:hypothetical protein